MDEELFVELRKCVDAERDGGVRSSFTSAPLTGIPLQLVEAGYLIPEWYGPMIVFRVSDEGFRAVAH
jgi:hypothetical protein